MDLQDVQELTNFFERRVSAYSLDRRRGQFRRGFLISLRLGIFAWIFRGATEEFIQASALATTFHDWPVASFAPYSS